MEKKLAYIAGPYTAPTIRERDKNVRRAAKVAERVWANGHAAICPHLNNYRMESLFVNQEWEKGFACFLTGDLEIISRCDAIIMLPNWQNSKGACAEYVFAKWFGIPVYICSMDLE